jgi:hypothetical protein
LSAEPLLRLVAFRSTADAAVLDTALRERVLPEIGRLPGIELLYAARRAPWESGERVIVTVRTVGLGVAAGRDEVAFLTALGPELVDPTLIDGGEVMPIASSVRFERSEAPRILRVYRGVVVPGRLAAYIQRADDGARADGATITGLCGLHLASEPPGRFITVSTWLDWASIEQATGGDVRRPMATRHPELIAHGEAAHFEIVPTVEPPPAAPRVGRR